ncbi:helix-turn-helix transcriptional regulator [Pseudoalteromonas sp. SMS1]|uniref:helix-turn-helix transcriptional regulator n=1 Tax=Pseudoalteromonas sp. SMS1 TaxID=2908894 RepID=UPI002E2293B3
MNNHNLENTFSNILSFKPLIVAAGNLDTLAHIDHWLRDIAARIHSDSIHLIGFTPLSPTSYQHQIIGPKSYEIEEILNLDVIYEHCRESHTPCSLNVKDSTYGLIIPIRGVSGILGSILITSESYITPQQQEWYWSILGPHLLLALKRCISKETVKITKRERDCILWASEGKTSWEISQILGISERTVNFHLSNCIEKTNSANRQQAIVKYLFNHSL